MIIRGVTESGIYNALELANLDLDGNLKFLDKPEAITQHRLSWKLRLSVNDLDKVGCRRGVTPFTEKPRRIRSACYHAYGCFMVGIFEQNTDASIHTAFTTYRGVRHFGWMYEAVGRQNIGSVYRPVSFCDACNCHEHTEDPMALIPYQDDLKGWAVGLHEDR